MNKKLLRAIFKQIPPNRNISPKKDWRFKNINENEIRIEIPTTTPQNVKKVMIFEVEKKEIEE